jgi:hypothetical protein
MDKFIRNMLPTPSKDNINCVITDDNLFSPSIEPNVNNVSEIPVSCTVCSLAMSFSSRPFNP